MTAPLRGLPAADRTLVVGVLNVTPDSFSDGGSYPVPAEAIKAGLTMAAAGADLVDVGGESTRPGAARVDAAEERRRIGPVVHELAAAGVPVSIDTTRASVAAVALDLGARLVNDVSGGGDPDLLALVAERGVPYVLMHGRGPSADMTSRAVYADVVAEVTAELAGRLDAVLAAGVALDQIVLDPGIGFAKTAAHNWAVLAHLDALARLGRPLLVGVSRKSFLGRLLAGPDGTPRPVDERDDATQAVTGLLAGEGVWGVRVHAVRPAADAVRVAAAWRAAGATGTAGRTDAGAGRDTPGRPAPRPDRVELRGLRVRGRHGVLPAERELGQEFVVDAAIELDTRPAATSDEVTDTVHYGELAERLAAVVAGEPVALIETLADRLAAVCLAEPRVLAAEISVHKPAAPVPVPFGDVVVTIRRERAAR